METVVRKIGNSVGAIFPKDISPAVGETYTIVKECTVLGKKTS